MPDNTKTTYPKARLTAPFLAKLYRTTPRQIRDWEAEGAPLGCPLRLEMWFAERRTHPAHIAEMFSQNDEDNHLDDAINNRLGLGNHWAHWTLGEIEAMLAGHVALILHLTKFATDDNDEITTEPWAGMIETLRKCGPPLQEIANTLRDCAEVDIKRKDQE